MSLASQLNFLGTDPRVVTLANGGLDFIQDYNAVESVLLLSGIAGATRAI